jgi:hypothetical protein
VGRAACLAAIIATISAPAIEATHQTDFKWRDYYWNGHNNLVSFCFDTTWPAGNYQNRAIDAKNAWNDVKSELYYRWDTPSTCNDMVLQWHPVGFPYPDNTFGYFESSLCGTPSGRVCDAWIHMDSTENWYTGIGTPTSNQLDLRSAVSHEWGHTTTMKHETSDSSYVLYTTLNFGQVRYVPKCHESTTVRTMYGSDGTPTCRP